MGFARQEYWSGVPSPSLASKLRHAQNASQPPEARREALTQLSLTDSQGPSPADTLISRLLASKTMRPQISVVQAHLIDFPGGSDGKVSAYNAGDLGSIPESRRSLWRRKWQPTPVLLPGKSHGWKSLAGYSLWGRKE